MTDPLIVETADKALAAATTETVLRTAEREGWVPELWQTAAGIGLPWVSVPEEAGGVGGTIDDAVAVLGVAGAHAVPLPLAETGLLAGWLLGSVGLAVGEGPDTVVPGTVGDDLHLRGGRLHGTARRVPWGRVADRIVAIVDNHVVVVAGRQAEVVNGVNLAGEPRDDLVFMATEPEAVVLAPAGIDSAGLQARGTLGRVGLMAGALLSMATLTVTYANERRQFGRRIADFQAVQALLVVCNEEAALVDLAAQVAAREADRGPAGFEIYAAKALANRAALTATRAAHQAHGAMGMTSEYPLHHLSRRLWSWRAEYGGDTIRGRLGAAVAERGADELYAIIANGSASGIVV